jgi:hypothetical protein
VLLLDRRAGGARWIQAAGARSAFGQLGGTGADGAGDRVDRPVREAETDERLRPGRQGRDRSCGLEIALTG